MAGMMEAAGRSADESVEPVFHSCVLRWLSRLTLLHRSDAVIVITNCASSKLAQFVIIGVLFLLVIMPFCNFF
jgi:hypothetical protein